MSQGPSEQEMGLFFEQTLKLLKDSRSTDASLQKEVQKRSDEWSQMPEYNYALMCITANPNSCDETTRSLGCLVLKNNIRKHYVTFPDNLKSFIKEKSLDLLMDPSSVIRATTGILITNVAATGEIYTWDELFPTLGKLISSNEVDIVESAFVALFRICEDLADMFTTESLIKILDAMLPRFLEFFGHHSAKVRNYALMCINQFVTNHAPSMMNLIDKYVEALHVLANDQDSGIKKNVCRSLVNLFETKPSALVPSLDNVITYMIARSKDEDDEIALEACELWLTLPESECGRQALRPHLQQLIPLLMERMRHSQEDIEMMRADIEDDYMVPDREDDMRPRFYRGKHSGDQQRAPGDDISDIDENEVAAFADEDGDEDEEDEDETTGWNIRKCTAGALDCLSHSYADEILPFVFSELDKTLNHENWIIKEAAVLTIGAIAEGSLTGMIPHLPNLIPFLVAHMSDKHPLVRSITCWSLSRYSIWISQKHQENYLNIVLNGLLRCITDDNKRVQEAACSAFATLAESAGQELVPYLDQILPVLVQAFEKYQQKNLLNLYDAIGTVAEVVKQLLNQSKYIELLLPPIIRKWNSLKDTDYALFPLLECLSSVVVALGDGFKPYCEAVFRRCVHLVDQNLQQEIAHNLDPENTEAPNKDFMVAALDLLSGIAEGIKGDIAPLVASSNVIELTIQCINDNLPEVRQSAFALLGDMTKACFHLLEPHAAKFMSPLARNLQTEHVSVCNNATWAIGELAILMRGDIRQYAPMLLGPLLTNINQPSIGRTLMDNTAITIGRLALACPDDMALILKEFIKPWCNTVRLIRDTEAKDSAFRGICQLIRKNPDGILNDFFHFCDAVACWGEPNPDLKQSFYEILNGFKTQVGEQSWQQFTQSFPPEMKAKLSAEYGV